jgi:uncharacterized Fe-S cluster protein YjdI
MLRVRPAFFTSDLDSARRVLEALGLVVTEEGEGWAILDAGSGRVELRRIDAGLLADGTAELAVEIRQPEEFARRTLEAGGAVVVLDDVVTISGGDGFEFVAHQTTHAAVCADADQRITVRAAWLTPDPAAARKTLAAIGAKPSGADDFRAKNGGILSVRQSDAASSGPLCFEYDGDLVTVAQKLTEAGAEVTITPTSLEVNGPGVVFTVMTPSLRML